MLRLMVYACPVAVVLCCTCQAVAGHDRTPRIRRAGSVRMVDLWCAAAREGSPGVRARRLYCVRGEVRGCPAPHPLRSPDALQRAQKDEPDPFRDQEDVPVRMATGGNGGVPPPQGSNPPSLLSPPPPPAHPHTSPAPTPHPPNASPRPLSRP